MKFFTMNWWRGLQSDTDHDPVPDFQAHLETIRSRLPPDLLALQQSISLHDSRLRRLSLSWSTREMTIELDGSDARGGSRKFLLTYQQLQSFESTADPNIGLGGPHGYGDLGYDEADISACGHLEHRMLFSSGIEFRIVFAGFKLTWQDQN